MYVSVSENYYSIVDFNPDDPVRIYTANPLLTCFAFVVFYRSNDGQEGAFIYHAKSGMPDKFREIHDQLSDCTFTKAAIAIPDDYLDGLPITKQLVRHGLAELKTVFNVDAKDVTIRERTNIYSIDNTGQHGVAIIDTSLGRFSLEAITARQEFLTELATALNDHQFIITNWLGCKVSGKPDGVKQISNLLSKWQNGVKCAENVAICYQAVLQELQNRLKENSADRTLETRLFYFSWLERAVDLKNVGLRKFLKY